MDLRDRIDQWARRLELSLETLAGAGAEVDPMFRAGAPAGHVLRDVEHDVRRPIPEVLRSILVEQAALRGAWRLGDELESALPARSRLVSWGGIDLSVREVVAAEQSRQGWVAECFSNPADAYDAVWHHKFAFHTVPNGDCLAIGDDDPTGAVYYLSHDDGEGHGVQLAPSLVSFLDRWSRLAFAGPEDWLLLPFTSAAAAGLEDRGAHASEWRAALGLTALEES